MMGIRLRQRSELCSRGDRRPSATRCWKTSTRRARGILVNITAGPDLSLGEYAAVGDHRAPSPEAATVKVGAVIDADMRDELHVTVVATGLGRARESRSRWSTTPLQVGERCRLLQHWPPRARAESTSVNYKDYERPTVQRQSHAVLPRPHARNTQDDLDYLDIPAFPSRQAD